MSNNETKRKAIDWALRGYEEGEALEFDGGMLENILDIQVAQVELTAILLHAIIGGERLKEAAKTLNQGEQ